MKKIKFIIMLIMTIAIIAPAWGGRPDNAVDSGISFYELWGEVSIRPNAEYDDSYEFAEYDTIIYEDDRIRTKEESGAVLLLADNFCTYVIKEESIVVIHTVEERIPTKIEMIAGSIWGNIKKMAQGKSIELEMSHCVLGMKGTIFKLTQSKDGKSNKIEVLRGLITTTLDSGNTVEVAGGHRLETTDDPSCRFQLMKLDSNEFSNLENEYNKTMEMVDEKLDGPKLNNKLSNQISDINITNEKLENSYKSLQEQKETAYQSKELKNLMNISKQQEALALQASRYQGALKEAEITISVAKRKTENSSISSAEKPVNDCWATIAKIEQFTIDLQKAIDELKSEDNKSLNASTSDLGEIDSLYMGVMSLLEGISDSESYEFYKSLKAKCKKLIKIFNNSDASEQYAYVRNSIQKTLEKLEAIPEINAETIRNINYINKNIPSNLKEAKKTIARFTAVKDGSDVKTKKSFIENSERTLAKCRRSLKVFEKTKTIFEQAIASFEKSEYKTSEYKQCKELWEKIEQTIPELEHEIEELTSSSEAVKTNL